MRTSNIQKKHGGMLLGLLALAQLIISVDYNIVYVALPEIGADLGMTQSSLQWVVSAYALAFGGFLLLGGRACDRLGARRVYLAGLAAYALGSAAAGLAGTASLVIAGRVAQGLGGALLFPAVLTLISTRFEEGPVRNRAFAVWGTVGGAGMVVGSLAGGVLTQWLGWSSVFYVNVPLAVFAIVASLRVITPDATQNHGSESYDLAGAVSATGGVSLVILGLVAASENGFADVSALATMAAGALLLISFVFIERRAADPLVSAALIRHRNLAAGMVVTAFFMGSFGTVLYFLTLFLQDVRGFSAMQTGLAFVPPMIGIITGSQIGGRLVAARGPFAVMATSMAVGALSMLALAVQLGSASAYLPLIPALTVLGLAQGAGWTVMFAGSTAGLPESSQGAASGLASTTQQIGGAAGLAILVAISSTVADGTSGAATTALTHGIRAALVAAAVGAALAGVAAVGFRRRISPTADDAASATRRAAHSASTGAAA